LGLKTKGPVEGLSKGRPANTCKDGEQVGQSKHQWRHSSLGYLPPLTCIERARSVFAGQVLERPFVWPNRWLDRPRGFDLSSSL